MCFFQGLGIVALTIASTLIGVKWAALGVEWPAVIALLLCAAGVAALANLPSGRRSRALAERR